MFEANADLPTLEKKIRLTPSAVMSPLMFEYSLFQRARQIRKHIVLPEGTDDRILQAAEILRLRDVVELTILGEENKLRSRAATLGLKLDDVQFIGILCFVKFFCIDFVKSSLGIDCKPFFYRGQFQIHSMLDFILLLHLLSPLPTQSPAQQSICQRPVYLIR